MIVFDLYIANVSEDQARYVYEGNDNLIALKETQLANLSSTYVSAGTCTAVLKNNDGSAVTGTAVTLSLVSASIGQWEGTLPSTSSVAHGGNYFFELTFVSGIEDVFIKKRVYGRNRESGLRA